MAKRPRVSDKDQSMSFKRYLLSENKTFGSLFFPEKDQLLALVDDFEGKRGKFAIPGYPNKLGLLLHGPPGTGKTSLIKALAAYTKRHIVSVNLAQVKTNEELMDLFNDLVFPVRGAELPLALNFENVVFVMEDIDAASKVVYARTEAKAKKKRAARSPSDAPGGTRTPETDGSPSGCGALDSESDAELPESPKENTAKAVMESLVECVQAIAQDDGSEKKGPAPLGSAAQRPRPTPEWHCRDDDQLHLAGLLNVLDGVVDSPGRILVMTTNHPEKLDPALIRPGRINKQLHLGPMQATNLVQMLEHFLCTTLSKAQRARLDALAAERVLTPARVEQACAEAADFDELLRLIA